MPCFSRQYSSSSWVSARWVCSSTPRSRASSAVRTSRSVVTENGEHGARATRHMENGCRVVVLVDHPLAVAQDLVGGLHRVVRRQAAGRSAAAHAAAGGVKAGAHRGGGVDGDVEQLVRRLPGEQVEVIGGGGAAGQQQLGDADPGAHLDRLRRQAPPHLVEPEQPVEQLGVLHPRQVAGQGLEQVVVGVDEARVDDPVGSIEDASVAVGRRLRGPGRWPRFAHLRSAGRHQCSGGSPSTMVTSVSIPLRSSRWSRGMSNLLLMR